MSVRRLGISTPLQIALAMLTIEVACRHGGCGAAVPVTPIKFEPLAPKAAIADKLAIQDKVEATTENDPLTLYIPQAGIPLDNGRALEQLINNK